MITATLCFFELITLGLEIANNVADGVEVVEIILVNDDVKSFLTQIHKVCELERIDAEIAGELCLHSNVISTDSKLLN